MTVSVAIAERLARIVGPEHVIVRDDELKVYECDGLTSMRQAPEAVVLPLTTEQVSQVVKLAKEVGAVIVPRGAGTGLSGGALPVKGSWVLGLSRMKQILEVDLENGFVRVEPGVINLDVSKRLAPKGYYYAPDPSSQSVCTIGGNVAENSGGAHCLKYGFTVNHVLGATVVVGDGTIVKLGGPVLDSPGYDLIAAVVGSEGTLGICTEVTLKILRTPESTRTLFATFDTTAQAGDAVSAIIAAGIVPAAIEMMDRLAIEAIKRATGVDWPDVGAGLLMDVDGCQAEVAWTVEHATALARKAGALEVRLPKDDAERLVMWKGRKSAFAAMGRLAKNYVVQDGVIPRSEIARVLGQIEEISKKSGLRIANVFHAGDGNLHPLVLYDAANEGEEARAEHAAGEVLKLCVAAGGSITGEHGVGADKAQYMGEMFTDDDLATMGWLRCTFDPEQRMNPGKVFPTPRLCGDKPGKYVPHTHESPDVGRG